jgi:hypothetical protein
MAKLIPAAERIIRARKLIQQAREIPVPAEMGKKDFSYIANVKMKADVKKIYQEIEDAEREILYS